VLPGPHIAMMDTPQNAPPAPHPMAVGLWDVAAAAAVPEGGMLAVRLGDQALLLSRFGEAVHAVGGTCPHAGAPLGEGVRCGDRVVCPWHKASFDLRSGARREPPAVDALPAFEVQVVNGRVLVTPPAAAPAAGAPGRKDGRCFVLLGAGAAGQAAAQTLREEGFAGRVVMVSREAELPYDRTLLSKYRLSGAEGGEKTPLQDGAFYERHRIERLVGEIAEVDVTAGTLRFADGRRLSYDAAVLATGGEARRPALPGIGLPGVFVLRVSADADAILAAAAEGRRVVVVGGGFIAMEAAASLRERGLAVTVILPEAAPFERQVGPRLGAVFARLHAQKGVVLRPRQKVAAFEGEGAVRAVVLESGERVPADLVVIGAGIRPATASLRGLALREDGGVGVDRLLQAGPRFYAAGDVAAFPLYGNGSQTRVEHWRVAQQQGRVAALNMLGREVPYDAVPYFWTIHYLKRLDYIGYAPDWDDIVVDGDLEIPEFIAFFVKDGRVAAVAGWDRDADMARLLCLLEGRRDWPPDALRAALAKARAGR
jgi:apoptosis-inducing factor 3